MFIQVPAVGSGVAKILVAKSRLITLTIRWVGSVCKKLASAKKDEGYVKFDLPEQFRFHFCILPTFFPCSLLPTLTPDLPSGTLNLRNGRTNSTSCHDSSNCKK